MRKIGLGLLAIMLFFQVFATPIHAASNVGQAKSIYNKASKVQWSVGIEKPATKSAIYKTLKPYFETKYIDKYFENFTMKIKKKGVTYYQIPPTDFVPGLLWKNEFTWSKNTKVKKYRKNGYDYLIISEKFNDDGLYGPHTNYYKFRKKVKNKTYRVYDYVFKAEPI